MTEAMTVQGGRLFLTDDSDPEQIRRELDMSKAAFKRAVGHLLKQEKIGMDEKSLFLK